MISRTDQRVEMIEREIADVVRRHSYAPEIAVVALADLAGGAAGQYHLQVEEVQAVLRAAFFRASDRRETVATPGAPR